MPTISKLGKLKRWVANKAALMTSAPDLYCAAVARDVIAEQILDRRVRGIIISSSRDAAKSGGVPIVINFTNDAAIHMTYNAKSKRFSIYGSAPYKRVSIYENVPSDKAPETGSAIITPIEKGYSRDELGGLFKKAAFAEPVIEIN